MSVAPLLKKAATQMLTRIPSDRRVALLGAVPFFEVLEADERKKLADRAFPRHYEAGDTVVGQGDYGHTMFILVTGQVRIEAENDVGQKVTLATLKESGMYFGEVAFLGRSRRTASVIAEVPTDLLEIEKTPFEQANKASHGHLLEALRQANSARQVSTFLANHRYFAALKPGAIESLAGQARIVTYDRGKTIYDVGDTDKDVLLLKTSMAKLVRPREEGGKKQESILNYFNAGDVVGLKASGGKRVDRLVSMGFTEVVAIDRDFLLSILGKDYKDLMDQMAREMGEKPEELQGVMSQGKTVAIFVSSLLEEGAQEGQSLLNINLNLCVRCGNCVKSCHDRHGYARFSRRGKKLVRRSQGATGVHETILLPASCRHCVNPECMIGCPTGAIHRKPGGEVDIHPYCIGCASCANRCPWGNISMVTTPKPRRFETVIAGQKVEKDWTQIATKCNLCHGYEYSNCVHNCPTGALLRVDPTQYWDEVAEVFRGKGQAIGSSTVAKKKRFELTHLILGMVTLLTVIAMVGLKAFEFVQVGDHTPYSWQMLVLGVMALTFFMGATSLAIRRRIKGIKFKVGKETDEIQYKAFQPGSFLVWTRAHFYLGALALVATWLHSGFELGGTVTSTIMILTYIVIATGSFGVVYYKWLPRRITNIEGESQVEEDLIVELHDIEKRRKEFVEGASPALNALANKIKGAGGGIMARVSLGYDLGKKQEEVRGKFQAAIDALPDDNEKETARRLINDAVRLKDINAARWFYRTRRGWLLMHIAMVTCVLTLVFIHVLAVTFFWG